MKLRGRFEQERVTNIGAVRAAIVFRPTVTAIVPAWPAASVSGESRGRRRAQATPAQYRSGAVFGLNSTATWRPSLGAMHRPHTRHAGRDPRPPATAPALPRPPCSGPLRPRSSAPPSSMITSAAAGLARHRRRHAGKLASGRSFCRPARWFPRSAWYVVPIACRMRPPAARPAPFAYPVPQPYLSRRPRQINASHVHLLQIQK